MYIERASFSCFWTSRQRYWMEEHRGLLSPKHAVLLLPPTTNFPCILQRFGITLSHTNEFMKDHAFKSPRKIWRHDLSSQLYTQLKQLWNKSQLKKKSRPSKDSNPWPLHTGAVLYQLSYQANWEPLVSSSVIYGTARRWWRIQINMWKIIYLNCEERYEDMIGHRSYTQHIGNF